MTTSPGASIRLVAGGGPLANPPRGGREMTEPAEMGGLIDTETALRREVDVLAPRFPQLHRDELDRLVHETYAELADAAEVQSHLVAVTHGRVIEKLKERGLEIHIPADGT
jgi:hypothetical protein